MSLWQFYFCSQRPARATMIAKRPEIIIMIILFISAGACQRGWHPLLRGFRKDLWLPASRSDARDLSARVGNCPLQAKYYSCDSSFRKPWMAGQRWRKLLPLLVGNASLRSLWGMRMHPAFCPRCTNNEVLLTITLLPTFCEIVFPRASFAHSSRQANTVR